MPQILILSSLTPNKVVQTYVDGVDLAKLLQQGHDIRLLRPFVQLPHPQCSAAN